MNHLGKDGTFYNVLSILIIFSKDVRWFKLGVIKKEDLAQELRLWVLTSFVAWQVTKFSQLYFH